MVVTVAYSDGTTAEVEHAAVQVTGVDTQVAGQQEAVVTYIEAGIMLTATFVVAAGEHHGRGLERSRPPGRPRCKLGRRVGDRAVR